MHLIWYNGKTSEYEYVISFEQKRAKEGNADNFTVLMEFPRDDGKLASKLIEELNQANDEHAVAF
jgi:hypothetical protein